jgi:hypothetical protein
VQLDRLTDEEQEAVIRYSIDSYKKKRETQYWNKIATLMAEGLTEDQAREKVYQNVVDSGDLEGAKKVREYQNIVHPLKNGDQQPLPTPKPLPPA